MNKLLEDLKQKFPAKEVAPYGPCLVVPGAEFDPDWEAELDESGVACIFADLDQKPVTLVLLKDLPDPEAGERGVYHPQSAPKDTKNKPKFWTPEEDDVLIRLWNSQLPIEKMPPSIPTRTEAAIRLRIQRLEHHGTIKKRTRQGRPKKLKAEYGFKKKFARKITDFAVGLSKSVDPAYSTRDIAEKILEKFGAKVSHVAIHKWIMEGASQVDASVEKSADTPVPTQIPTSLPPPAKDEVVELLKQILDAVKPEEELVCFESYCPVCRESRSVEDSNVWKACPVCGGSLIVWNVEIEEAPS